MESETGQVGGREGGVEYTDPWILGSRSHRARGEDCADFVVDASDLKEGFADDLFFLEVDPSGDVLDETSAAELVLPLMETAQLVQAQLAALTGIDLTNLPAPWDDFAHEALATITTAMQPFR